MLVAVYNRSFKLWPAEVPCGAGEVTLQAVELSAASLSHCHCLSSAWYR